MYRRLEDLCIAGQMLVCTIRTPGQTPSSDNEREENEKSVNPKNNGRDGYITVGRELLLNFMGCEGNFK